MIGADYWGGTRSLLDWFWNARAIVEAAVGRDAGVLNEDMCPWAFIEDYREVAESDHLNPLTRGDEGELVDVHTRDGLVLRAYRYRNGEVLTSLDEA